MAEFILSGLIAAMIAMFCGLVMGGFAVLIFEFGWFSAIPIAVFLFVWFGVYKVLTEE